MALFKSRFSSPSSLKLRLCASCHLFVPASSSSCCPMHDVLAITSAAYVSASASRAAYGRGDIGVAGAGVGVCFGVDSTWNVAESLTNDVISLASDSKTKTSSGKREEVLRREGSLRRKARSPTSKASRSIPSAIPSSTARRLSVYAAIRALDRTRALLYDAAKTAMVRRSQSCQGCITGECRESEELSVEKKLVGESVRQIVIACDPYVADGIMDPNKSWRRRSRRLSDAKMQGIGQEAVQTSSWFGTKKRPSPADWALFRELEHEVLEISRIYNVKVTFVHIPEATSALDLARVAARDGVEEEVVSGEHE